jgi:L-iditol 2-dehydrogenase
MATQTSNAETGPNLPTKLPATMRAVVYRGSERHARGDGARARRSARANCWSKIATCGICGTDLKKIHTGSHSAPRIFGHEMAGTIVAEVAQGVTRSQWASA